MLQEKVKKNGKPNTQLELGHRRHAVSVVVLKLIEQLQKCRVHVAGGQWKYTMGRRSVTMSDANLRRVFHTDFGAVLDLMAAEKDNCSVNNHAVVCILFVTYDWRLVKYKRKDGTMDETIICTTDKWAFFGSTQTRGKKNDHVYHNACLKYLIKFYDHKRVKVGKAPIPQNLKDHGMRIVKLLRRE